MSRMMTTLTSEPFWSANQPGFRFTDHEPGTPEFYAEVEKHRYELEPHIAEIAQLERWRERDVLEVGCGIATDCVNFARAGGRYAGVDRVRWPWSSRGGAFSWKTYLASSSRLPRPACRLTMNPSTLSFRME